MSSRGNFGPVVVVDFEYETEGGEFGLISGDLPQPLCMVAYVLDEHLRHVHTIKLWRGRFGRAPPFDVGDDTLFVGYSAWAELTCFLVLGWKFPKHVFDLHTCYLAASNILRPHDPDEVYKRPRRRLPDACRAYTIEGWENINKETISEDIGKGHWRKYGRDVVFTYCEEDVRKSVELLRRQLCGRPGLPPASVEHVLHWSNYSAKSIARIQARGMLTDVERWNLVQENKAAVIGELLRRFDPSYGSDEPIYTPEGEWSYARFERWLVRSGVTAWPRLDSGQLDTDGDAFRMMSFIPGIAGLHALRDSLNVIVRAKLPIGRDGRNRPSLFPFCTATGRNAHAKSLFNAHAGMRSFLIAPPDATMVYLDWKAQEIGVIGALAHDETLMRHYREGDVYYSFARAAGLTDDPDRQHWKDANKDQRQRMKSLNLAIIYGMSVPSLAKGINRHPLIASRLFEWHRRLYPRVWEYREARVQRAMLDRRIESEYGWPLHISTSPNKRTLYNFPAQGNGAECLRLAAWRLCEAGIVPSMLIHDGILIEARDQEQIEHAIEIMRAAGRDVCNGFELDVEIDQRLKPGQRYRDKRELAQQMWASIMDVLETVRAVPKRAAS